jgi:hypothetical protein
MIAKCACQHCGGGIEFEANELAEEKSLVTCPHCGLETKLFTTVAAAPPASDSDIDAMVAGLTVTEIGKMVRAADPVMKKRIIAAAGKQNRASLAETEAQILAFQTKMNDMRSKIFSHGDTLEISGGSVIIRKRGLANMLASGMNGERSISISSLTGIQLKLGALFSPGYILFSYAGSKPFFGGVIEATQDPDGFMFARDLNDQVKAFKDRVEVLMREAVRPSSPVPPQASLSDELRKLAELRDQGTLTQQEFEAAKKRLLS